MTPDSPAITPKFEKHEELKELDLQSDSLPRRLRRFSVAWRAMRRLDKLNRRSSESLLSTEGPVVSLTTHGPRLHKVYYSIESIAQGSLKPSRLILWLDDKDFAVPLPIELTRLVSRGLEIRETRNYGPHTKYFPYVSLQAHHDVPLVTADDDVLYSSDWLQQLQSAHRLAPSGVHALKVRRIVLEEDGSLAPYSRWKAGADNLPSPLNFGLGVSGVIYPPALLDVLAAEGDAFKAVCPRADDVWLHVMASRHGFLVQQVHAQAVGYPTVRGTNEFGLMNTNVNQSGNDVQIAATYTATDIARLQLAARPSASDYSL